MLSRSCLRTSTRAFSSSRTLLEVEKKAVSPKPLQGWIFIESVFPIQFARWDPRSFVVSFQEQLILAKLQETLKSCIPNDVKLLSLQSRMKDGGAFATVEYPQSIEHSGEASLLSIVEHIQIESGKRGGLPAWPLTMRKVGVWAVKGEPWLEDLNRFVSPVLKVEFEGPDVHVEDLWRLFRPFGKIQGITTPTPVPAGSLRSSLITFSNFHSAATARNCIHGDLYTGLDGKTTRLATTFEPQIKGHFFRDWVSSHPRISLPVAVLLLGALTYTIFDPLRTLAVEGKMLHWFNWHEYAAVQWLRKLTTNLIPFRRKDKQLAEPNLWKDREESIKSIETYLHDLPETASFVYGPSGSGKTSTLRDIVDDSRRWALHIDCDDLCSGGSDRSLLQSLASQTGYWPYFSFLDSVNNMLDLASASMIGKPAGFSTSTSSQIDEMLKVVASALKRVNAKGEKNIKSSQRENANHSHDESRDRDSESSPNSKSDFSPSVGIGSEEEKTSRSRSSDSNYSKRSTNGVAQSSVDALPIVILKNYGSKNSRDKDDILNALARWAARLIDLKIAHVFIVSDNRESAGRIAKALSSTPINYIPFSDADKESALKFVTDTVSKIRGESSSLSSEEIELVGRLGGRANDLQTLVHKVQNGESVSFAVKDIISRGVAEIRKTAFGDDSEESKALPWSQSQAWSIVKQLAKNDELAYHRTLLDSFKDEENALRAMEKAELITLNIQDGRRTTIRAGKPVYKWVFKELVQDKVFSSVQEIQSKEKSLSKAERAIAESEDELVKLRDITDLETKWNPFGSAGISRRIGHLMKQLEENESTRFRLEQEIDHLKTSLASKDR